MRMQETDLVSPVDRRRPVYIAFVDVRAVISNAVHASRSRYPKTQKVCLLDAHMKFERIHPTRADARTRGNFRE